MKRNNATHDENASQPNERRKKPLYKRDLPFFIKLILLILLIILLIGEFWSGEMDFRFTEWNWSTWIILIIKLLLISILIWLIRVQHNLEAILKTPTGCVKEKSDFTTGKIYVEITGTARGAVFSHYTLEINQGANPPIPNIISYPGGAITGTNQVVDGKLGEIDTLLLEDGSYTVTLRVYPLGSGSPKVDTITFNLLKVLVCMKNVGALETMDLTVSPPNPNFLIETAELCKDMGGGNYEIQSIGGNMTIDGMAYIYGCNNRKIVKYEIRYAKVTAPGSEPSQPPTLSSIPETIWPMANTLVKIDYTSPDYYNFWTKLGPGPTNLMKYFSSFELFGVTYYYLKDKKWISSTDGSGRYSLLLIAEDSIGARFYDIQHIWLDNLPVFALITGIKTVAPCATLKLSDFVSSGMEILGIAWDSVIDSAFDIDKAPNDNFDSYTLTLEKQGGGTHTIGTYGDRVIVPFRKSGATPTSAEAGTLAIFDIALVIDDNSASKNPAVSIPRAKGCAYILHLHVRDNTRLHDDVHVHNAWAQWPFCIVNDLKD